MSLKSLKPTTLGLTTALASAVLATPVLATDDHRTLDIYKETGVQLSQAAGTDATATRIDTPEHTAGDARDLGDATETAQLGVADRPQAARPERSSFLGLTVEYAYPNHVAGDDRSVGDIAPR